MRARTIGAVVLVGVGPRGHRVHRVRWRRRRSPRAASPSGCRPTRRRRTGSRSSRRRTPQFQKDHPGVTVNVQYQTWGNHLQKFDATLAGGNAPDVIEMGNTEMTKYMAAGAFQDLTVRQGVDPELGHVARRGSRPPGRYGGKLYGVPYYAGSRVVTYRTDLFKKAGRQGADEPRAVHGRRARSSRRRTATKGFSPVYIAGTDWYFAMSFVYDFGGSIATQVSGKWKGTLASPQVDRRARPRTRTSSPPPRGRARRPTRRTRTRTTCTPRATPRRWSAPAGSAAASATSTRPSRSSS